MKERMPQPQMVCEAYKVAGEAELATAGEKAGRTTAGERAVKRCCEREGSNMAQEAEEMT